MCRWCWPGRRSSQPVELAIAPPRSPLAREFAELARVLTGSLGAGSHVILVTDAAPGRGASLVAANLAAALSRSQPDVILICGDLEDSVIPTMVSLPVGLGFTDLLTANSSAFGVGDQVAPAPRLRVIGPGSAALADTEDLRQDAVERLLTDLRTEARWIVVEAPSITVSVDAYTLAQVADAAILVVEVPSTTSEQVLASIEHLERMGANMLGAAVVPSLGAAAQRSVVGPIEAGPMALASQPAVSPSDNSQSSQRMARAARAGRTAGPSRNTRSGQSGRTSRNTRGSQSGQNTRNSRTGQSARTGQRRAPNAGRADAPCRPISSTVMRPTEGNETEQASGEPTVIINWAEAKEVPSPAPRS